MIESRGRSRIRAAIQTKIGKGSGAAHRPDGQAAFRRFRQSLASSSMRIDHLLYFAPGITFDEVDLSGRGLPEQFRARIEGFYLRPAELCADAGAAFAAGVLVLACIDAMARIQIGGGVGERFRKFAARELSSFKSAENAARLYHEFRNGLIHEARIKEGAQFSLQFDATITGLDGVLVINPRCLIHEVREALARYVELLQMGSEAISRLKSILREDHTRDRRF